MVQLLALVVAVLLVWLNAPFVGTLATIGGLTYLLAWIFGVIKGAARG